MLPIGCMRVFMTPSCSSVVIRFRRCDVLRKAGVVDGARELQDLVAGEHQFADEVHQLVEQADVDADRAVGDAAVAASRGFAGSRVDGRTLVAADGIGRLIGLVD